MLGEDKEDLSLRECILGKVKLADYNNEGKIHSSDFQLAVGSLGLKYSDAVVSNILMKCDVDMDGYLVYGPLEKQLESERYYASKKAEADLKKRQLYNHGQSSTGTVMEGMFEGIELQDQLAQAEKNRAVLQRHRDDVRAAWLKFTHSNMSMDKFVQFVRYMGMEPTKAFKDVIRKEGVDVALKDILTSLSHVDPSLFQVQSEDRLMTQAEQQTRNEVGKRHFYDKTDYSMNPFSDMRTEQRAMKYDRSLHGNRTLNSSQVGDSMKNAGGRAQAQFITQNRAVENAMALERTSDRPVSGMATIGSSQSKRGFIPGHTSAANSQNLGDDVCYSSEVRILREQTLVALRKVDEGVISGVEFIDNLKKLGLILPESVIGMVQRRGDIDYKACVKELDAEVFMKRAIYDRPAPSDIVEARKKLLEALLRRGSADSIANLARAFRIMDDDNDERLSFGEFRKGCRNFGVGNEVSDDDLRLLFTAFDRDGNGYLSYDELLVAIRGQLSPVRSAWAKAAFQKLDRSGDGVATVEDLVSVYDTSGHPDVMSGSKNKVEVLRTMLDAFDTKGSEDGVVTEKEFLDYFGALSASIDHDDHFIEMVKKSWKISELKPPHRTNRKTTAADHRVVALADGSNGDVVTWSADPETASELDSITPGASGTSNSRFRNKGMRGGKHGLGHHDSSLNIFKMSQSTEEGAHSGGVPNDEWLAAGAIRLKRNPNHRSVSAARGNILAWPGASGTKERRSEVSAKIQEAHREEEMRLFPKGPRLNSAIDAPMSQGFIAMANEAKIAERETIRVAGKTSSYDEFEAAEGELYFGPRIVTNALRSRDYNQSCPFGYDEPTQVERAKLATNIAPASAGGPTIGNRAPKKPQSTKINHNFTEG